MPQELASVNQDALGKCMPFLFLPSASVRALLSSARVVRVAKGTEFIRKGRFPSELLIPVAGRIARAGGEQGSASEVTGPYEPVGLELLLRNAPYPYSLSAADDSDILVLPWRPLKDLIDQVPRLAAYLRLVTESAAIRELDQTLDEMGCSPEFRCALGGALQLTSFAPGSWIVREGETPDFIFFCQLGTAQAYSRVGETELKPLWVIPHGAWELWDACLERQPLSHAIKAVSQVDVFKLPCAALEQLKAANPTGFEALAKIAARVRKQEDEDGDETAGEEVEDLEDLFPPPPRPVSKSRWIYPFVRQKDEMDCGPACLAMISKFYGNDLSIHFWRDRMGTDQAGTSLFDMAKAAEKVGFVSHGIQVDSLEGLEPSLFPLIALRQYHYLVIYKADAKTILAGDPAIGVRSILAADFAQGFDGMVLLLKPNEHFYQVVGPKSGYRHFLEMFKGLQFELGLIVLTSAVLTLLRMIPAFLSQFILDQVLAKKDSRMLAVGILVSVIVAGWIGVVSWLRAYYMNFLASRFDFSAGSGFLRKIFSLPYDFFATRHIGDFTRRFSELSRIRELFVNRLVNTGLDLLNLGFYGVVIFLYNPAVAIAVYISAPILVLISVLSSRRMQRQMNEAFSATADLMSLFTDQIKNIATIKTVAAEVASRWRFEEAFVRSLRAENDVAMTGATVNLFSSLLNQVIRIAVMGLAAYMAIRGDMTPGQVVSVSMLANGVIDPIYGLAQLWTEILYVKTTMDRLNDVFLSESEHRPDKRALIKQKLRGEIEFRDVWFRYGGESTDWVLKGMSFRLLPGQSVAVVGPSGAGKSTLALLTARLYEPTKGMILIDGRDSREYDRQWIRKQIGLLLQESNLFHGTLLENIAFGDARPNLARVEKAIETADAKKFIYEKSAGLEYMIPHGGMGLSGGQKQRIAIARMLYCDPTILFLDEGTASLDNKSERAIVAGLRAAAKNRTVINIAHRYSTIKMCDFVMVVMDGQAVEFGTHAELQRSGGYYAELFGQGQGDHG